MADSFGGSLRTLRTSAGISQAELAVRAGLSERSLTDLERGVHRVPSLETARRLVDALDLDPDQRATLLAARGESMSESNEDLEHARATAPRPKTHLFGREEEIATILHLLDRPGVRLFTLTGPGGIGKTRLALEVGAHLHVEARFEDGIHFVDLSATSDPSLVVSAIASVMGIRTTASRSLHDVLSDFLRSRQLLLILDNFEQLLPAALQIGELLDAAESVTMLVTSRERLQLSAEYVYSVPPLPFAGDTQREALNSLLTSDAGRLFVERARAVRSDFELTTANVDTIEAICRRLDGVPLAIELAAARIALFSPDALLSRMDRSLALLSNGPRDAPPRLRSMRDAIAWSYDLLSSEERRAFRSLSIFTGGWTIEAAERVCLLDATQPDPDTAPTVVDLLSSLAAKNLIQPSNHQDPDPYFIMLQTVREYGLEQLDAHGEMAAVGHRHADYYRTLVAQAAPALCGKDQARWLDRLERAFPNLRAAVLWALDHNSPEDGVRILAGLWRLWMVRGHVPEVRDLLARLIRQRDRLSDSALAIALVVASDLAQYQGDYAQAHTLGNEGLLAAHAASDDYATARALEVIGSAYKVQGNFNEAVDYLTKSLGWFETLHHQQWTARAMLMLGDARRDRGETDQARALLESSLAIARSIDDVWQVAWALNYLADLARAAGAYDQALYLDQEGLALNRDLRNDWGIIGSITGLATLAATWKQRERAVRLLGARSALRESLGLPPVWPMHLPWYTPMVQDLNMRLGDHAFHATWTEGSLLTIDQIVAEGLKVALPAKATRDPSSHPQLILSPRELEVMRLVVEGQSDREIGDALHISPRTATTHVSHILNKLGLDSRTAAAAYAVRHGLA